MDARGVRDLYAQGPDRFPQDTINKLRTVARLAGIEPPQIAGAPFILQEKTPAGGHPPLSHTQV